MCRCKVYVALESIHSTGSPLQHAPPLPTTTWAALYGEGTKCSIGLGHAGSLCCSPTPRSQSPCERGHRTRSWQRTKQLRPRSCPGIICTDGKRATLLLFLISFVQIWTRQEQLAPGTLLAHGGLVPTLCQTSLLQNPAHHPTGRQLGSLCLDRACPQSTQPTCRRLGHPA